MFGWLEGKSRHADADRLRDTLFGDMPLGAWARAGDQGVPWSQFADVETRLRLDDIPGATAVLRQIVATPDLASRHYLQAWHELRRLGVPPTTAAKQLLGVVVEVSLQGGLDIVTAYADHSARYSNYSGAAVVWERPDTSLDGQVDALWGAGEVILGRIGPWEGPRPAAPSGGDARISMLTPGGLYFGQAQFQTLAADTLTEPAITAAMALMQALIMRAQDMPSRA